MTGPATGSPSSRLRRRARRALQVAGGGAVALVVLLVSGLLPYQAVRVPTDSMAPTVAAGDHLLMDKLDRDAAVGDVVVVRDPLGDGLIVKRVIAVGGDEIGFEDGVLVRNGRPVAEPYTTDFLDGVYYGPDVVPPGQIYLLATTGSTRSTRATSVPCRCPRSWGGSRPGCSPPRARSAADRAV